MIDWVVEQLLVLVLKQFSFILYGENDRGLEISVFSDSYGAAGHVFWRLETLPLNNNQSDGLTSLLSLSISHSCTVGDTGTLHVLTTAVPVIEQWAGERHGKNSEAKWPVMSSGWIKAAWLCECHTSIESARDRVRWVWVWKWIHLCICMLEGDTRIVWQL